jgi:hypothetical protein
MALLAAVELIRDLSSLLVSALARLADSAAQPWHRLPDRMHAEPDEDQSRYCRASYTLIPGPGLLALLGLARTG